MRARVIDLVTVRRSHVPLAQRIGRTLRDVETHTRELRSERELGGIRDIIEVARELYAPERFSAACIGADEDRFRGALGPVSPALT